MAKLCPWCIHSIEEAPFSKKTLCSGQLISESISRLSATDEKLLSVVQMFWVLGSELFGAKEPL
jgi:hypothetical protein